MIFLKITSEIYREYDWKQSARLGAGSKSGTEKCYNEYMLNMLYPFGEWMHLILRLVVAVIFLAHGLPKAKNFKTAIDNFNAMGFRPGNFWCPCIVALEVIGGFLLFIGAGVQILGLLFAGEMFVATIWKIKNGQKLINGYELDILLFAACLALATWGGGLLSFDNGFKIF